MKRAVIHHMLEMGTLEERLKELQTQRADDVSIGAKSLIGTNVYADLLTPALEETHGVQTEGRLAEPFEKLSADFGVNQPSTVLLTFGELKDFKPRADFVSGFLATGGIQSQWSPAFIDVQAAIDWLAVEKPDYAIVCATPDVTKSVMEKLLSALPKGVLIDVAGNYEAEISERWMDAGLNGFIYSGQNKIAKLNDIKKLVNRR